MIAITRNIIIRITDAVGAILNLPSDRFISLIGGLILCIMIAADLARYSTLTTRAFTAAIAATVAFIYTARNNGSHPW